LFVFVFLLLSEDAPFPFGPFFFFARVFGVAR